MFTYAKQEKSQLSEHGQALPASRTQQEEDVPFPPELPPLQLLPFDFTILPELSTSEIRNVDVAGNLSYTGTQTAPGKEGDTPFLEAIIIITAVSSLLLKHCSDHSDTTGDRGAL